MSQDLCLHEILAISKSSDHYSSTTSSTSIGQAFAQIPQAIHLEAGLPRFYDQAKWTGLRTGSASRTFFLVDHVNALRVLGNGAFRTGLGTFTALRTGDRADSLFLYDLQTCLVRIKYLIKCLRTCSHTGKTSHTGAAFFTFSFFILFYPPLKDVVFPILPF